MLQLTVVNASNSTITIDYHRSTCTLAPSASTDIYYERRSRLQLCAIADKLASDPSIYPVTTLPWLATTGSWEAVSLSDDSPWRIYNMRVSRHHRKLLIHSRRNLTSFLSDISDSTSLSNMVLPGTHDTMAFYGWPISQCQSTTTPLATQLASGIRVIDIRLAVKESGLIAYHGVYPQKTPFREILTDIHTFLVSPESCREALVMSIKQEDFKDVAWLDFSRAVHQEISNGPGGLEMWFLENRIPNLGAVRGKVVMLSRFGGDGTGWENQLEGLGIHPTSWPDSEKSGFSWQCKDTLVQTHDWYDISSILAIPEKVSLATENLLQPPNNPPMPTLAISYFSAASFPLAFPPMVARGFGWPAVGLGMQGVNERVGKWLLDLLSDPKALSKSENEKGHPINAAPGELLIKGWVFLDYYAAPEGGAIVPLFVEANFTSQ